MLPILPSKAIEPSRASPGDLTTLAFLSTCKQKGRITALVFEPFQAPCWTSFSRIEAKGRIKENRGGFPKLFLCAGPGLGPCGSEYWTLDLLPGPEDL